MLGLPRESHRCLIEPVSGSTHIILHLYKRCVNFVWRLKNSKKLPLHVMCHEIVKNSCSTTGNNIRQLMLRYNAGTFEELWCNRRKTTPYKKAGEDDMWKIEAVIFHFSVFVYFSSDILGFENLFCSPAILSFASEI